jgi:enoyl-CoA hydratase/carnithine racemase
MMAVLYEKEDKIVTLTLELTSTPNRLDAESYQALGSALMDFRDDPEASVAIITGTGEFFSTGADHRTMLGPWAAGAYREPPMITRGLDIWKPLIAAVNGPARGGGLEIALACDIRIASENAYMQFPEVGSGLIPGLGGTQRLPRLISPAKAAEMILLGTPVSAEEACRIGLVNKVVPLAQLLPTARAWAAKICENRFFAVRRAKESMVRGMNMTLENGLRLELSFFEELLQGEDYQEKVRALAEEREPEYKEA